MDMVKLKTERFVIIKGYKLDKYIVGTALQIIFLTCMFGVFFALKNNVTFNSFECPIDPLNSSSLCKNPFYHSTWENLEYLTPGNYGITPFFVKYSFLLASLFIIVTLLINHILHNLNNDCVSNANCKECPLNKDCSRKDKKEC